MSSNDIWSSSIGGIDGTPWFCPRCGKGVMITSAPVQGVILNEDGTVHKHDDVPYLAGYLEGDEKATAAALKFAHQIDDRVRNK